MAQKVAVPAATIQDHAKEAVAEAQKLRAYGFHASADAVARAVTKAMELEEPENTGRLVSIDARAAATLAADGCSSAYSDGMRSMLEHQHWW